MSDHISQLPPGKSAYDRHKCRCDDCRAANAAYSRALRARTDRNARGLAKAHARLQTLLVRWAREHISPQELEALREEAKDYIRARGVQV